MTSPTPPAVLIFRTALLGYSETFVPAQAEKLKRFTPWYAGLISVPGNLLPAERTIAPPSAKWMGQLQDALAIFPAYFGTLLRRMDEVQPQLIHAHFEEGGIKAQGLAKWRKIPLVVTCHGYDVTVEEYRWQRYPIFGAYYQKRRRDLFASAHTFIGISRFICDQMLQRGYPKEKVRLHYIGVDTAKFAPDPTIARKPFVLFVGRLVEKKGCEDLVRAMGRLRDTFPDVELVIAGSGPLQEPLESLARELRVNARFLGSQSPDAVKKLMAECLLLCTPSVRAANGDAEGLGIVFLEAMAMATPVVATRHGGIPEVVEHGVTGLLCGERQPDELADAISTLLGDPALREQFGIAGRARAVQHFDLATQTHALEEIYLEALGSPR